MNFNATPNQSYKITLFNNNISLIGWMLIQYKYEWERVDTEIETKIMEFGAYIIHEDTLSLDNEWMEFLKAG